MFSQAKRAVDRAIRLDGEYPHGYNTRGIIRMAQLFAEVGDVDACLYYLGKTLQSGFRDRDRLHKDKAFEALRHTRAFIELVSSYGLQERTT